MTGTIELNAQWRGLVPYGEALKFQVSTREDVMQGGTDQLILLEHPHVYTFGKSADHNNLLANEQFLEKIGATVHQTERGGDITYHGPGQLVGYPILHLNRLNIGARRYVELLENSVIQLIGMYGIEGYQINGLTGIWVRSKDGSENKIGAIGIKISHGVTMHGFALNLNTDLQYFTYINPCGITDKGVTSLEKEIGKPLNMQTVAEQYALLFEKMLCQETTGA